MEVVTPERTSVRYGIYGTEGFHALGEFIECFRSPEVKPCHMDGFGVFLQLAPNQPYHAAKLVFNRANYVERDDEQFMSVAGKASLDNGKTYNLDFTGEFDLFAMKFNLLGDSGYLDFEDYLPSH